ncbi:hypothetical protein PVL29_020204 [Vitis rotundifolia]|uniref:Uncharacterized protein n=1 Tax=Vitis rotundifolia TaxID=103349 RepID=A0AA38Z2T6_VITRO|nr:hypothetical protein PVL29_020204 [Vitis rotundifolia]
MDPQSNILAFPLKNSTVTFSQEKKTSERCWQLKQKIYIYIYTNPLPIESGLNEEEVKIIGLFGVEMAPNKIEEEMKMEPPKEQEAKRPERRRSAIKRTKRRREKEREILVSLAKGARVIIITSKIYMEREGSGFVTRKILERSDTDASQNRFFIPKSEKREVEGGEGVETMVVDPKGGKYSMGLKKWVGLSKGCAVFCLECQETSPEINL